MRSRPMASRSGSTSILGKLDAELPKQRISGLTLGELQRMASEQGMALAEYIGLVLDVHAHGSDTVKRLHLSRVDAVVGMGGQRP